MFEPRFSGKTVQHSTHRAKRVNLIARANRNAKSFPLPQYKHIYRSMAPISENEQST